MGAVAGLVLALVTAESSGGDVAVLTGLLAGDRALSRAQEANESARDIALDADVLLATGLVVIGSAVGIAIGRKSKDDGRDAAVLSVAPVVGPSVAGIHALGRF